MESVVENTRCIELSKKYARPKTLPVQNSTASTMESCPFHEVGFGQFLRELLWTVDLDPQSSHDDFPHFSTASSAPRVQVLRTADRRADSAASRSRTAAALPFEMARRNGSLGAVDNAGSRLR
jgi:hypothetical protein